MPYSKEEVKSGMLISAALALLLGLTFTVGNFSRGVTQTCKTRFGYVNSLKKNAPVYYAGHEVGRVLDIAVEVGQEKPVVVTLQIPKSIILREDSHAFVDTMGLMGEKFVELVPGSSGAPALKTDAEILSTDPVRMYLLMQKMDSLATQMQSMMDSLDPMLHTHGEEISKIISNIHETSANLRDMTGDLKFRPWRLVRKG